MQRPRPVTLLAVLSCLLGASYVFTAALLATGKFPAADQLLAQMPSVAGVSKEEALRTLTVVAGVFGLLGLVIGLGLLGMKNWARATARGLCIFFLLGALVNMIQAFHENSAGNFLFFAVLGGVEYAAFWYLGQAQVRAAFGKLPPSALPPAGTPPEA